MEAKPGDSVNILAVKGFLSAQYAGETDRGFQTFASPDFTWVVSSRNNTELTEAIPWAGREHKGVAGYKELTTQLYGEFEPLSFTPSRFFDAEDTVFVIGNFVFKHRVTGKVADSDWVSRFDMKEGRITGGQFYENTYAVAACRKM